MLLSLDVRDFVIVDSLSLDFESGMTVLTGETGAGKSLLIDALSIALGARADAEWVRQGRERAEVAATFSPPDTLSVAIEDKESGETLEQDLRAWLEAEGFDHDEGTLHLKRQIDRQGRSKAWINGRSATAQQLKLLGEALLTIHGQHAHQSLLKPNHQRALLDAFGGLESLVREVAEAWKRWQQTLHALAAFETSEKALKDEEAALQREREDLSSVAPDAEVWDALQQEQARLSHAATLIQGAESIVSVLSEGEAPALSMLNQAISTLSDLTAIDASLKPSLDLIESAVISLEEAESDIRKYGHRVELDPTRLSEVDQKIQGVLTLSRRYRLTPETLGARLLEVNQRLEVLGVAMSKDALQKAHDEAHAEYQARARALSARRREVAKSLEAKVTDSIRLLAMGEGEFVVSWGTLSGGSRYGDESVVFAWTQYPGQAPTPIAKTASGGELSRISLAIQTALTSVSDVPTMIFDEVDTGIGGRVAEIVGKLLHDVASGAQVMCVTHLPQVAAWGDHHLTVSKTSLPGEAPVSEIRPLDHEARVEEIARMLGGVTLTETTRAHARELLSQAL